MRFSSFKPSEKVGLIANKIKSFAIFVFKGVGGGNTKLPTENCHSLIPNFIHHVCLRCWSFVYAFTVLSHCNVHPVVLLLTVSCGFFADVNVMYMHFYDQNLDPLDRFLT